MSGLPKNWTLTTLGELSQIVYGKGLPTKNLIPNGYPVFGANGIIGSYSEYLYERAQLLISCRGANSGTINMSPPKCYITNNSLIVDFSIEPETLRKTYFYFLQAANKERLVTGTAQPQVTINNAVEISLPLAPLNEQKRIVAKIEEFFSELDKGIESLKTAREQLKVYRQAVLKHAFEGKLTADWRNKNKSKLKSADKLIEIIKKEREDAAKVLGKNKLKEIRPLSDEDFNWLSELPSNWCWERLGWMTCGIEYGTGAKSSETGDVPVLRMGNIQNMKFDWSDLVHTSDQDEIQSYSLKKGDVLFNRTNSPELVGKTAIYNGERPALFAGYLMRVNQIDSIVDARYLNFYLNSHTAKQYGNKVKTDGVNQSNINGEKLAHYPFPYCSLEEQKVIVSILESQISSIDRTEEDIDFQLNKAEALRQAILKKAFSGELVAQDLNDEPASLLLERIRAEKQLSSNSTQRRKRA